MALLMGPVLSFRGHDPATSQWNLTALVVADAAPGDLTITGQAGSAVTPETLWKVGDRTAYRYTFSLLLQAQASTATYKVQNKSYEVALPGANQSPTMAYASCNGFSSEKLRKSMKGHENILWTRMAKKHGLIPQTGKDPRDPKTPYHLLLLGGDQVYADSMWEIAGPMKDWLDLDWADGNAADVPASMRKWLDDFYFNLYVERWSQPEVAAMFAAVPSIAMWDDHDIMDGWGSYPKERQTCPVYGAIWKSACKAFAVFQQQLKDNEQRPGAIGTRPGGNFPVTEGAFSFGYIVGSLAILAIDMRSQRTGETQVIGKDHWKEIYAWIVALSPVGLCHLLVMSSIPVIYPGFDIVETLLGIYPGHQDLEDDLRDHWNSQPHRGERTRLIRRLLAVPKAIRPLILSGDVHVAALGVVESDRPQTTQTAINQLISSGIVHPGPGAIVLFALHNLFDRDEELERGLVMRMMKFPNNTSKFIGSRNFLSLEPDIDRDRPRIWANWLVENMEFAVTKVIEPN